ncbi:hypothetical protein AB0K11_15300 [Mycobacterium sp. NPDC050551]|uniref:DUF7373 family lipoprotein n=1 Tax=Mycobacterium sp. NPDC050551 TaxID=3155407 RepID=UPI00341F244D
MKIATPTTMLVRALPFWLTAAMLVTACAPTVTGQALRDPDAPPAVTLDTGNYPTAPRPALGVAGPNGAAIEAHRMADAVVGPWEVDPSLLEINANTRVWKEPRALVTSIPEPVPTIAANNHFLTGFSTSRSSDAPGATLAALEIAVMRFPTVEDAAAAAATMPAQTAARSQPVPLDGHPDATAASTEVPGGVGMFSYTPRGVFVIYTWARARDSNTDVAARATARALDLQKPRLDAFVPTPPDEFSKLPVDPDGVLALAVPVAPGDLTVVHGSWNPRGALHYSTNPIVSGALFDKAHVTTVANALDTLYRTEQPADSTTLLDGLLDEASREPNPRRTDIAPVPGVPAARCVDNGEVPPDAPKTGSPRFECRFSVDRYVASLSSQQLEDLHQRTAAQYLMLTAT